MTVLSLSLQYKSNLGKVFYDIFMLIDPLQYVIKLLEKTH